MRLLTASPLCVPSLLDGGDDAQPLDFFALCNEAAAAGAAAMLLPSSRPLSLMHLAVASGSAEMVDVLLFWLQDSCGAPFAAAPRGGAAGGTLAGEPWLTALAHQAMTPVHLAALLPRRDVAEVLLSGSLVACAVWLALPCASGATPAALAAARGDEQEDGPWAADMTALARGRLAAMVHGGPAAAATAAAADADAHEQQYPAAAAMEEARRAPEPALPAAAGPPLPPPPRPTPQAAAGAAAGRPPPAAPPAARAASAPDAAAGGAAAEGAGLPALRVISTTSSTPSEGSALYKRAPPSFTSSYDDIPSPRKGAAEDIPSSRKGSASPEGKPTAAGGSGAAAAAPSLPPPPPRLRAAAAGALPVPVPGGSPLFRMFEGLSFLMLLSLGVEVVIVPSPESTVGDLVADIPAVPLAPEAAAPEVPFWTVAAHAAHAMPLAALVGLVLVGMLGAGLVMTALDRARARRAARAEAAVRGGSGAEVWPPAFASDQLEAEYEEVGGAWPHARTAGGAPCRAMQGGAGQCKRHGTALPRAADRGAPQAPPPAYSAPRTCCRH
jgi:hypothetical protein